MDTAVLEDLGLTHAEITVYVTLLELGSAHAGQVLEKSGLANSVVHRALNSLIEKGIVNYVLEGRRRVYHATDPESFYGYIDEKKRQFTEILPALKEKQKLAGTSEAARIYKGLRGIKEVYSIMIEGGPEYLTFGGGHAVAERMGMAWWRNLHTRRIAKRLPSRQVFDESVRAQSGDIAGRPITSIRWLPAEFASFQETVIVGDKVAINVFTEEPYSFLIEDASVAEGYKKHFEVLWERAKA